MTAPPSSGVVHAAGTGCWLRSWWRVCGVVCEQVVGGKIGIFGLLVLGQMVLRAGTGHEVGS